LVAGGGFEPPTFGL